MADNAKNVVTVTEPQKARRPIWAILLTVGIILLMILGAIWLGKKIFEKPVASHEVPATLECPDCNCSCPECPVVQQPLDKPTVPNSGSLTLGGGDERICKYAEGFNSEGKVVKSGTKVTGPAFVKPNRDIDWGYPIYVGEEYVTTASDEVVWILEGDNACVDAQSQFFSYWGITKP